MDIAKTLNIGISSSLRKDNSIVFLDGKVGNNEQVWQDRSKNNITIQNGSTSEADTNDTTVATIGYSFAGDDYLKKPTGESVPWGTLSNFCITGIYSLDSLSVNHNFFYALFGYSAYPRCNYYASTDEIKFQYSLDGAVKLITISSVSDYISADTPFVLTITGSVSSGVKIYINGAEFGSDSQTGVAYDTSSTNAFAIGKDSSSNYYLQGECRYFRIDPEYFSALRVANFYNALSSGSYLS